MWREGLLAQAVLAGRAKGYRFHPQLVRFRAYRDPVKAISAYLWGVADEATSRGYNFDTSKIAVARSEVENVELCVTEDQLRYEALHLSKKLEVRTSGSRRADLLEPSIEPNPLFRVVRGPVEDWEVAYWKSREHRNDPGAGNRNERRRGIAG